MTTSAPVRCKCRKQAITGLRCSRCFVPICPDCSRPASVGMLCRDCARGKPSHLYIVDPKSLAIAIPLTLLAALFGGWLIASMPGLGFFAVFAALIYGGAVGEVALRLTGRKRGLVMEVLAGASTLAGLAGGYTLHTLAMRSYQAVNPLLAARAGVDPGSLAFSFLLDPWIYVTVAVSIVAAVGRIRSIG